MFRYFGFGLEHAGTYWYQITICLVHLCLSTLDLPPYSLNFMFFCSMIRTHQAYHLESGWQCKRICHICSSVDWHNPTDEAEWVQEHEAGSAPTAIKVGNPPPFLEIPGLADAKSMELDYCHANHLGIGIDAAASTVVLLARLGHFGYDSFERRLSVGYGRFMSWCHSDKKNTSIKEFSKLAFDMASILLLYWSKLSSLWDFQKIRLRTQIKLTFYLGKQLPAQDKWLPDESGWQGVWYRLNHVMAGIGDVSAIGDLAAAAWNLLYNEQFGQCYFNQKEPNNGTQRMENHWHWCCQCLWLRMSRCIWWLATTYLVATLSFAFADLLESFCAARSGEWLWSMAWTWMWLGQV